MVPAHRVSYELEVGPIPEGLELDHVKKRGCRSTRCVAVEHLEPVTNVENNLRSNSMSARNARKTECLNGHEFNEANTRTRPDGQRDCRVCVRDRRRKYRELKAGVKP